MAGSKDKSRLAFFGATIVLAALAAAAALQVVRGQARVTEVHEQRYRTYQLANQLRQSSDDLTRMARLYAVTGDVRYKEYFERILAIRKGDAVRPADYGNAYWDLVVDAREYPQVEEGAEAVALADLMAEASFSADELGLWQEAENASDELAAIETEAMGAAPDELAVAGANQHDAVKELHGPDYNRRKARIMQPIADMHSILEERTAAAVENAAHRHDTASHVLIVALALLLLVNAGALVRAVAGSRTT